MTDQELALALVERGVLTPQQVHTAAARRAPGRDLAQVLVDAGWVSGEQLTAMGQAPTRPGAADSTPTASGGTAEPSAQAVGLGQENQAYQDGSGVVLEDEDEGQSAADALAGNTVAVCNQLLLQAVALRASDLHLEPTEDGLLPRFRVDGQLRSGRLIPRESQPSIVSRLKLMAKMNIAETRLSQDGRFRARVGGRRFDFRVSSLPGVHGEKVVMRLLDPSALVTDLTRLGFTQRQREDFEEMLGRAHGMILVTGPTGSGKTTTLYAALAATRDETKNVVTVEDPVEYEMKGIMQCQVHSEIGNTFAARLRSILRQDPDVILVGEVRDTETADMAIRAALTGHLVLSTLHTNSAAAAVTRLQDMDVPPFLIASSLTGVLAQRLVRLICRRCRQPMPTDSEEYALNLAQWKLDPGTILYHGAGCAECNGSGLRGRVALLELLSVDKTIRKAIMNREDADSLHRIAVENGMPTLYQDGLDKLKRGLTTPKEIARVFLGTEDME